MTQDQEKQLLQAIYDRLFSALTYQPKGDFNNPFSEKETFIHFSKNASVNPKSFENALTPENPLGDLKASEAFSRMVDMVSPFSLEWENTSKQLSFTYENIIQGGNSKKEPDPEAEEQYKEALEFLTVTKEETFMKKTSIVTVDSEPYANYKKNMNKYTNAILAYRASYNLYLDDLESKDPDVRKRADRNWQAKAPLLENNIQMAYDEISAGNGRYVEQALKILNTSINDSVKSFLESAKEAVNKNHKLASSLGSAGNDWLLSYPSPSNWTSPGSLDFTELKISGGSTDIRSESSKHTFSMDTSLNYGLWRVKASSEGSFEHSNSKVDKDSVEISAKIAKVNIVRPWFMESIFGVDNWTTNAVNPPRKISNGKIDSSNKDNLLPMYPVAFIVAKDIKIKANFSREEEEHIKKAIKAGASVGWGPFSIGGSYGYGKTEDKFHSDFQNGEIKVPGMQIIAWVSRVILNSPR